MRKRNTIIFVLLPGLLLFLFAEITLRLGGFSFYPADLAFRIDEQYRVFTEGADKGFYVTSPRKTGIFIEQRFAVKKPVENYRIFILGGSTINYLGGFERLKKQLEARYAGKTVEIINCGGLSYGTTRLLLVFQEVLGYDSDLVILYSGHNEFEEECLKTPGGDKGFLGRLNESMLNIRLYQLFSRVFYEVKKVRPLFSPATNVVWGRSFDEKQKTGIYKTYQNNVEQMVRLAKNKGIAMIVCAVAYNRLGRPPFYSSLYGTYDAFVKSINPDKIKAAVGTDTNDPMLEFEIGKLCYAEGDFEKAKSHLERAYVLDAQPHRANRITNNIAKQIAKKYHIPLVDIDGRMAAESRGGIPEQRFFSDHCHLSELGKEILQDEMYNVIKAELR